MTRAAGSLAVDFGTSNTVLSWWDPDCRTVRPLGLPDLSRASSDDSPPLIPSLITYQADHRLLGAQVEDRRLVDSPATFRWMKRYLSYYRSPPRRIGGRSIDASEAGRDFLAGVLRLALEEQSSPEAAVVMTAPVEAFEPFEAWLDGVARKAGISTVRVVDEASAAALGYGLKLERGDGFLVFDFGGGTLDVSVVLMEEPEPTRPRVRVLGKAGAELGGATIDQWLFQAVLKEHEVAGHSELARRLGPRLLLACEEAKERLSREQEVEVALPHPETGEPLWPTRFTRERLQRLFEQHQGFERIENALRRALAAAEERGYREADLVAALLCGGSSHIPLVVERLQERFGPDRLRRDAPLFAVARGAARLAGGSQLIDHIQHDYAIRYLDPVSGRYDYRLLVKRGAPYPSPEPLCRIYIKAAFDGQSRLGVAIFELAEPEIAPAEGFELLFDPLGAARLVETDPEELVERNRRWLNESRPTFLTADPPGRRGEPRFEVAFAIDGHKRLCISARDLAHQTMVYRMKPVVQLR